MFADDAPAPALSISDLEILTIQPIAGAPGHTITANLSGTLFTKSDTFIVNGRSVSAADYLGRSLYRLKFDMLPEDQTLNVIIQQGENIARKSFSKPVTLKIDKFDVLNFKPASPKEKGALTIRLKGTGFETGLAVSINGVAVAPPNQLIVVSPTEAVLLVNDPPETMLLTIQNTATGGSTSVLVVRPNVPEERANERTPRQ